MFVFVYLSLILFYINTFTLFVAFEHIDIIYAIHRSIENSNYC